MSTRDLSVPPRVLAVGAHPDDVEFGCGATLAKWAALGAHCELLVLTDGSKGSWDIDADTTALIAAREREQEAAANVLGVRGVHFGRAVDGELAVTLEARAQVCATIRAVRPDIVLGHDPWKQYRLHPDHHAAGRLVIDGLVAARDPHFFPDAGIPHRPTELLLFEAQVVDHLELLDDEHVDTKITALLAHHSQWRSTMEIDLDASELEMRGQREAFAARVRTPLEQTEPTTAGRFAESFKRISEL